MSTGEATGADPAAGPGSAATGTPVAVGAAAARPRWWWTRLLVAVAVVAAWLAAYLVNGPLWDRIVYHLLGLDPASRLGSGVHFFCYDSVKIVLLLVAIIFVVTVLRSFMSVERTRALLGGRREGVGNVMAAGLGVAIDRVDQAFPILVAFPYFGVEPPGGVQSPAGDPLRTI